MARTIESTRRRFLFQLSSLGVLVARPTHAIAQDRLPEREIPSTGEALPVVGLGSTKAVLQIPDEGTDPLASVLRMLVERGGRVVDTAPRPEAIDAEFGRLLRELGLPDDLFLTCKIDATGSAAGVEQMRQTQRLFGRRTMDLVQVASLRDLETQWRNLRGWKETGEARYIGVTVSTNDAHPRLESFMRSEAPDFVHLNYSVMETGAEARLLPLARDRGVAVLTNRPFMNGAYFGRVGGRVLPAWAAEFDCTSWAQFSLKYILSNQAVTCVLTETTNPQHMEENIQAASRRLPDEATKRRMRELVGGL